MRDFRYALRSLARSKGFVAVAVVSLALALGLNTTVYAVLDAFINPYVPYRAPERLVRYAITGNWQGERAISRNDRYLFLRERVRFADTTAIYTLGQQLVESDGSGENVSVADVSRNFFTVLDVAPARGRIFQPVGDDNTIVVSDGLWRRLTKKRALDGQPVVTVAGRGYTVIGVMPPEMRLPDAAEAWRPLPADALLSGVPDQSIQIVSRLKRGLEPERAKAELNQLVQELQQGRFAGTRVSLYAWFKTLEPDPSQLSQSHWALAACAVIVLLIACANLANLMLARGIARRGELALRLAIGASRQALIRQLTVEALVLAVAGGLLGVTWAVWGVSLAIGKLPTVQTFITLRPMHLSWRIFAFALVATGLTTMLVGLLPAIRVSDVSVADPLKDSSSTTTGRTRGRYSLLAIAQVALALTLLMSSAILVRSTSQMVTEESDLNLAGAASVFVPYPSEGRPAGPLLEHVLQRVRAIPGVELAATHRGIGLARFSGPPAQRRGGGPVVADGKGAADRPLMVRGYTEVSIDYLRVYRRRIVAGRHFDSTEADVMIVNQTAARQLWPQRDAIGHSLRIDNGPWIRVVGVVEDVRSGGRHRAPEPELYHLPASSQARAGNIVFRPIRV
jgi:predicted permease